LRSHAGAWERSSIVKLARKAGDSRRSRHRSHGPPWERSRGRSSVPKPRKTVTQERHRLAFPRWSVGTIIDSGKESGRIRDSPLPESHVIRRGEPRVRPSPPLDHPFSTAKIAAASSATSVWLPASMFLSGAVPRSISSPPMMRVKRDLNLSARLIWLFRLFPS